MKRLLLLPLILVALGSTATAAPRLVEVPRSFGKWMIAFVREHDIWTARGDGTGQRLIIKNGDAPCWSKDKRRLAFYRDGNIWVADAKSRNQRQLTHYGNKHARRAQDVRISWNARTGAITFSSPEHMSVSTGGRSCELTGVSIFDLYPIGLGKPRLSARFDVTDGGTSFNYTNNENPAWSKSGTVLAFTRNGDIWTALYSPPDGDRPGWDVSRLAAVARYDSPTYRCSRWNVGVTALSWSPDGNSLAYVLERLDGSGQNDLHVITLQRNGTPRLAVAKDEVLIDLDTPKHSGGDYWEPKNACFSPGGNWIAFSTFDDASTIYAVSADGKSLVRLIRNASRPAW